MKKEDIYIVENTREGIEHTDDELEYITGGNIWGDMYETNEITIIVL